MPLIYPSHGLKSIHSLKHFVRHYRVRSKKWDRVIAVTRGGMVPACLVARELDIRVIDTISVKSYDHQSQSRAEVLKLPEGAGSGKNCLIVDDLSDTGNTFKAIRQILPDATYACLHTKPTGKPFTILCG